MSEPDWTEWPLKPTLEGLLVERGPMSVAELVEALRETGLQLEADAEDELLEDMYEAMDGAFEPLVDGRWAYLPDLIRNRVMTHRLSEREIADDAVIVIPDLAAMLALDDDSDLLRLVDGETLTFVFPAPLQPGELMEPVQDRAGESLALPPGTLAGLGATDGDLLSLTTTAEGIELALVAGDEVTPFPETVRHRWIAVVGEGHPTEITQAVLAVYAGVDQAFRVPYPPFDDLFDELGFVRRNAWMAAAGVDLANYWTTADAKRIAEDYEIDHDEALAVHAFSTEFNALLLTLYAAARSDHPEAHGAASVGSTLSSVGPTSPLLARPWVASVVLEETLNAGPSAAEALVLLVGRLTEHASRSVRPALAWLEAKAYESLGQIRVAEEALQAAERLDPDWPLPLLDLARYASDRGDAPRGLSLLARAAPYEDLDLAEVLRSFQPEPGPTLGRNQPCWCGSGRKFKQCHLHHSALSPLSERAAWLYQKAGRFLGDGAWTDAVADVATQRAAYADGDAEIQSALTDPLVGDAVLFEGGAFRDFVEQRGFLLPEDEQLLAAQWLLVDRSVFEITAVRPGSGFSARDLRSGETAEVRDRAGSRSVKVRDLICARIVPAGDTTQVSGGIEPVHPPDLDLLLDLLNSGPEADVLVAFLSRRFAPPVLPNTDGGPS
ncbi:MAG TPA: SEC-C domain-containing protein [Propionibacteriaceae bacterium]